MHLDDLGTVLEIQYPRGEQRGNLSGSARSSDWRHVMKPKLYPQAGVADPCPFLQSRRLPCKSWLRRKPDLRDLGVSKETLAKDTSLEPLITVAPTGRQMP